MAKTPRKIGIIISGGNSWEIVFCFLQLQNRGFLRLPITIYNASSTETVEFEKNLSRSTPVYLGEVKATGIDAIIVSGGMRLFDTLCNFHTAEDTWRIDEGLKNILKGIFRLDKPIGALGPAALLVVKALQGITDFGPVVTIGNDPMLQAGIESTGAQAVITRPGEVVLDEANKLVTSGGELATSRPTEVNAACENLIAGLDEFIKGRK